MLKSLQNGESDAIPESMYSLISVLSHRSNIVSAFSGFSLRILELASKSDSALFNEIYPELCRTLCDIPPLSLQRQRGNVAQRPSRDNQPSFTTPTPESRPFWAI